MLELIDTGPAVEVLEAEYARLLGYPRSHVLSGRSRELAAGARDWYREHGRPWWYARRTESLDVAAGIVVLDGTPFRSPRLADVLTAAGAESAMLVAVSAGPQCEAEARRRWEDGRPDEYFFLEVFGSAVVESLVAALSFRLCAWADEHGLAVLPHYSPGYPEWDIADQRALLSLIEDGSRGACPAGIGALESGMLVPKKSLLAVFGITRDVAAVRRLTSLVPCETCSLSGCRYRRAPHRRSLPLTDAVLPAAPSGSSGAERGEAGLTAGAQYSIGPEVLRKWQRERLRLTVSPEGAVEARFRYDGTTCSDLGRPLAFEYRVRLSAPGDGYRIVAMACAPAAGDEGHRSMCRYVEDPGALMDGIAGDRPLLGHPLEDVLGWRRADSPAGCYCTAESRAHKWGLVLQVLHFALAQDDLGGAGPRGGPGPGPGRQERRAGTADGRETP